LVFCKSGLQVALRHKTSSPAQLGEKGFPTDRKKVDY